MANQPTKYRKFVVGAASAALVASAVAPVASAKDFSDTKGNTHEPAIDALSDAGIITGYQDGTFKPNKTLTRSDVVKLMGKWLVSEGYEVPSDYKTNPRFTDLTSASNDELLKYAAVVKDNGVFNGSNGRLLAGDNITRENMAVVLVRAFDTVNDFNLVEYVAEQDFKKEVTDRNAAKAEARTAIDVLDFFDITTVATFNPKDTTTRGHFASFLHRALNTDFSAVTGVVAGVESITPVNNTTVEVKFVEAVEDLASLDFKIDGLEITNKVIKQTDAKTVVLTTAVQEGAKVYTVTANGNKLGTFTGVSAVVPTDIKVTTPSVQGTIGKDVTVSAQVTVPEGQSKAGIPVTFNIVNDNINLNGKLEAVAYTNADGVASYTYTRYYQANDNVAAYATHKSSVVSHGKVYWAQALTISEVTEGNVLANGSKKVYKVNGPANTHVNVTFEENVNVTPDKGVRGVTVTDATFGNGTTPFQYLNGNVNQVRVLLNSKGEATFTITGTNASVTPIVFADSGADFNSANQWVGGNGKLDPTELQAKAPTVKFENIQTIELVIDSKGTSYASARNLVPNVTKGGRDYEVTVRNKDGKLAGANTPVYLVVAEADREGNVYYQDSKGVETLITNNTITLLTNKDGVAKFTLTGDKNAWAVPTVYLENGTKAGLDTNDAQVRGEIVYFGEVSSRSAEVHAVDADGEDIKSINADGSIASFVYQVVDQNNKKINAVESHNATFEISNTGFNDAQYLDPRTGLWTTIKAGTYTSVPFTAVNGASKLDVRANAVTNVTVNVSGSQYSLANSSATVAFVSPVVTVGNRNITAINTVNKTITLTDGKNTNTLSYGGTSLLYNQGSPIAPDKFEALVNKSIKEDGKYPQVHYTKVGEQNSFNLTGVTTNIPAAEGLEFTSTIVDGSAPVVVNLTNRSAVVEAGATLAVEDSLGNTIQAPIVKVADGEYTATITTAQLAILANGVITATYGDFAPAKAALNKAVAPLNVAIAEAKAFAETLDAADYEAGAVDAYKAAIKKAEDAVKADATKADVDKAIADLATAKETLEAAVVGEKFVTDVTNSPDAFGFTNITGKYVVGEVDKIEFFIGDDETPREATLNNDGTFELDAAAAPGTKLTFKAYKSDTVVQEGTYTVVNVEVE